MNTRTSHKLVVGLMTAMILSAGCTAEQLQRVRDTIDVADKAIETAGKAVDTTRKAIDTVEEGAKVAACMKENACLRQSTARQSSEHDPIMDILKESLQ